MTEKGNLLLSETTLWGALKNQTGKKAYDILYVKIGTEIHLLDTRVKGCHLNKEDLIKLNPNLKPLGIYAEACANCFHSPLNYKQNHTRKCKAVQLPI